MNKDSELGFGAGPNTNYSDVSEPPPAYYSLGAHPGAQPNPTNNFPSTTTANNFKGSTTANNFQSRTTAHNISDRSTCAFLAWCCFIPIANIAIAKSVSCKEALSRGDLELARKLSGEALFYSVLAICLGTLLCGIIIATTVVLILSRTNRL